MNEIVGKKMLLMRVGITVFWCCFIAALVSLSGNTFFTKERSITVLAWSGTFDRQYVKKFEQSTGIKVYLSYYSSNEELLVKLRATGGRGYDLVVPSDYAVGMLRAEKLLKKIDKSRLTFYSALNPLLLGLPFDPLNDYSVPFEWEIYCIGIDRNFFASSEKITQPWDLIFGSHERYAPESASQTAVSSRINISSQMNIPLQTTAKKDSGKPLVLHARRSLGEEGSSSKDTSAQQGDYRIIMTNDPLEAVVFAAGYLFGKIDTLAEEQICQIQRLLIKQKQWVEAYTNVRADYFLGTGSAHAAIVQSSEAWRAMRLYKNVDFIVPEKTFISIEHCAIPIGCEREDLVYTFLNFMCTKESFIHHFQQFFCPPARLDVIDELEASDRQKKLMQPTAEDFQNYSFIRNILPEKRRYDLWVVLKS